MFTLYVHVLYIYGNMFTIYGYVFTIFVHAITLNVHTTIIASRLKATPLKQHSTDSMYLEATFFNRLLFTALIIYCEIYNGICLQEVRQPIH